MFQHHSSFAVNTFPTAIISCCSSNVTLLYLSSRICSYIYTHFLIYLYLLDDVVPQILLHVELKKLPQLLISSVIAAAFGLANVSSVFQIFLYFGGLKSPAHLSSAAYSSSFFFAAGLMFLGTAILISTNSSPFLVWIPFSLSLILLPD